MCTVKWFALLWSRIFGRIRHGPQRQLVACVAQCGANGELIGPSTRAQINLNITTISYWQAPVHNPSVSIIINWKSVQV